MTGRSSGSVFANAISSKNILEAKSRLDQQHQHCSSSWSEQQHENPRQKKTR